MVRPSRPLRAQNARSERKPAHHIKRPNAVGFAKRQERKKNLDISDIYEYTSRGEKRSNVTATLSREDLKDSRNPGNSDDEDGSDTAGDRQAPHNFHTGMDEDGVVNSQDDEEIDSDEAFEGDSDEERFIGFKFSKGKKPKPSKPAPGQDQMIDLNESENDEEMNEQSEEDGEGAVEGVMDLSQMLDLPGGADEGEGSDEGEGEGGDDTSEGEDALALSDDEGEALVNDDALNALSSFVEGLESNKRKGLGGGEPPSKRRLLSDRTEAAAEGEFSVPAPTSKLRVEDLLAPLAASGTNPSSLLSLKQSAKALASTSKKTAPLSAPLPTRVQDRLDREAAYEQTKKEVQKWEPTMKMIRNAEHLSFPLQPHSSETPSTAQLASKFKPSNEMESAIDNLLKTAKLREEDIAMTEELHMKDLTVEEVRARHAELRRARELMFRADVKAHRIAKIKSKTYRRIHRKLKEKNQLGLDELEQLDPDMAQAERLKLETDRARERATLRHKNGGQWMKNMKGAEGDLDKRRDIMGMLERGEQLRRKIAGAGDEEEGDGQSDTDEDIDAIKKRAFEELEAIEKDQGSSTTVNKSGVFQMKFMKDAQARKMDETNKLIDDFRNELGDVGEQSEMEADQPPSSAQVNRVGNGRFIYQPSGFTSSAANRVLPTNKSKPVGYTESETSTIKSSDHGLNTSPNTITQEVASPVLAESSAGLDQANPWLTRLEEQTSSSKVGRKHNEILLDKNSSLATKSTNALRKQQRKSEAARTQQRDDAEVEIQLDNVLTLSQKPTNAPGVRPSGSKPDRKGKGREKISPEGVEPAFLGSGDEDAGSDGEPSASTQPKALLQRDLVALAFAGDNVIEQFEKMKQKEVMEEAPKQEDFTLPGWGSWTGKGLSRQKTNPKFVRKIAGINPSERADFGKSHVIISEKKDKKAARFMVKDLPFPYTSKAQYERSLEVPIGTEWNTRIGFQKATLPKVVKKMGTVINPLERLF